MSDPSILLISEVYMAAEIERKWLLDNLPKNLLKGQKPQFIEQCYVNYEVETRIRKWINNEKPYLMTLKKDGK